MHDESTRERFTTYIYELKPFVAFSLLVFILSTIAGYAFYSIETEYALGSLGGMEDLARMIQDLSAFEIMLFIFLNNAVKMFFSILLGFALGIVPLGFLLLNAFVIGIFINYQASESGFLFVVAGLVPHGIIEIPMLIISSAVGMKIGYVALQTLRSEPVDLGSEIIRGVRFYLHWLFPLIFLAAVIETFITPVIIHLVTGI